MKFSRQTIANEIAKRVSAGKTARLPKSIAAYLIENNKTSELNSLERDVIQRRAELENIVELNAISAHPLGKIQISTIERTVKKLYPSCRSVIVNQRIDESVIGGVRLEFANQLLDMSASAKLSKLRQLIS